MAPLYEWRCGAQHVRPLNGGVELHPAVRERMSKGVSPDTATPSSPTTAAEPTPAPAPTPVVGDVPEAVVPADWVFVYNAAAAPVGAAADSAAWSPLAAVAVAVVACPDGRIVSAVPDPATAPAWSPDALQPSALADAAAALAPGGVVPERACEYGLAIEVWQRWSAGSLDGLVDRLVHAVRQACLDRLMAMVASPTPAVADAWHAAHGGAWPAFAATVLVPWRQLLGLAEQLRLPACERVSATVRVPSWLVDDLLCELADYLRDLLPGRSPVTLLRRPAPGSAAAGAGAAADYGGAQPYEPQRRLRAGPSRAADAAAGRRAATTPRAYAVAAGLRRLAAAYRVTIPGEPPASAASPSFAVAEVVLAESASLTVYGLSKAQQEALVAAWQSLVRPFGPAGRILAAPWTR